MTIRAYELDIPGSTSNHGVVLVNSVTDLPLHVSAYTFTDLEDAEAFLGWLSSLGTDLRRVTETEVQDRALEWLSGARERSSS